MVCLQEIQFNMSKFIEFIAPEGDFPVEKTVVALGVFDGVHPGHRLVIQRARELAEQLSARTAALTFIPHPRQVLPGGNSVKLLIPEELRVKKLLASGAERVGKINFSPEIAGWEAGYFLAQLQSCGLFQLAGICVGSCWRFGKNGSGGRELLEEFCFQNGIAFIPVPEVVKDGQLISSSLIRQLISEGKLADLERLTGEKAELSGSVVSGMHLAGRELAAPTANLQVEYGVLPPDGVYSGSVDIDGRDFPAVLNIGKAPTYNVSQRRVEIHLIGFEGNLYDRKLTVRLKKFLREICCFSSPVELRGQIARDIADAVNSFAD